MASKKKSVVPSAGKVPGSKPEVFVFPDNYDPGVPYCSQCLSDVQEEMKQAEIEEMVIDVYTYSHSETVHINQPKLTREKI